MGLWCIHSFAYIMCTSVLFAYGILFRSPAVVYIHATVDILSDVYVCMYISFMGGGEEGQKKVSIFGKNETINIFSIASGHLYERFLRYIHIIHIPPLNHNLHNLHLSLTVKLRAQTVMATKIAD